MNRRPFLRLAVQSMARNRRATVPYLLSLIGIVMMAFILFALSATQSLTGIYGSRTLRSTLRFGSVVMTVFALIVAFYTHSFLVRQRKKEFALFNILGMEKRHIARMMGIETLITALATTITGMALGALFSKLMYLILLRLLMTGLTPDFQIPVSAWIYTALLFAVIHGLTLISAFRQVAVAQPMELLRSANKGEKDPPARLWLAAIGALTLGAGYWIAQIPQSPVEALLWFFVAVLLVIIGTYALFMAGSVSLLKGLRRNKRFYYQPRHFSVVAGLIHRMNRNAVGLATICILSTMVLVMVSGTASMFIGSRSRVREQMGRDAELSVSSLYSDEEAQVMISQIQRTAADHGIPVWDPYSFRRRAMWLSLNERRDQGVDRRDFGLDGSPFMMAQFAMVPVEDYNRVMGKDVRLAPGEVLSYSPPERPLSERFTLLRQPFSVAGTLESPHPLAFYMDPADINYLLVMREEDCDSLYAAWKEGEYELAVASAEAGDSDFDISREEFMRDAAAWNLIHAFDTGSLGATEAEAFWQAAEPVLQDAFNARFDRGIYIYLRHVDLEVADFNAVYGGLLFVASFLGLLFVLAMVLIIYYKQISEGYEDRERFQILCKVGMTEKEVRQSIRRQVLLVFFLPLLVAGVHTLMAFNILSRVLGVLDLNDRSQYAWVSAATFLIFSLFYFIVYWRTAKSYYKIVR